MAPPRSRPEFTLYCRRALGEPVISLNIDDDQIEDRIDEALDFWRNFNHDAVQIVPFKHQITANNITNQYIEVNPNMISVEYIYPIGGEQSGGTASSLFSYEYQVRLSDYLQFGYVSNIADYYFTKLNIAQNDEIYTGQQPIQFNRHMDRIYPYWDWEQISEGQWIIIQCMIALDGETYTDIWTDRILQKYAIALMKRQWGTNLSKFAGTTLLGGVTFNGPEMYSQAMEEIKQIEEEMRNTYEEPPRFITG